MIDLDTLAKAAEFYERSPTGQYDAEAALALRAGEVMMRRRFSPVKISDTAFSVLMEGDVIGSKWIGFTGTRSSNIQGARLEWPDPFTALVEADSWYRENVEKQS